MTGRTIALACAFALALAGVASAAAIAVDADELTLVRVPGAVPAKTCTVTSVADAHVDEALPDTNAGSGPTVAVDAATTDRRAFVRFDLGSCSIPAAAEVRSAALRMKLVAAPAENRTWGLRRVAGAWTEAGITWNTQPSLAVASTGTASTGTVAGATLEWNVLADVADIVDGTTAGHGWRIADANEAPLTAAGGTLAARENADATARPSLTVTWFD